jgi:hypothetical protein
MPPWGWLPQQPAGEILRESGSLLRDREIDPHDDGAIDVVVSKRRGLEAPAIEPGPHPGHFRAEIGLGNADLAGTKIHSFR